MTEAHCHASEATARALAREVILKGLTVSRIADWTGVSEGAVYQWMSRAKDGDLLPADRAAAIIQGAKADGIEFDPACIWPALTAAIRATVEPKPADEDWHAKSFLELEEVAP